MQNWYEVAAAGFSGALLGAATRTWVSQYSLSLWAARSLPVLCALAVGWHWSRFGAGAHGLAMCLLGWWMATLCAVDIGCRRLPNALTVVGGAAVSAAVVLEGVPATLLGGSALVAVYSVVHLSAPAAFGAGDVKLAWTAGTLSALGGTDTWAMAALVAPLVTAGVGVVALCLGRRGARIPHGPSMCAATLLALAASPA